MHRTLSVFFLSACLFLPVALKADDHQNDRRYYDRDHKDYHTWNNQEDKAYRVYLGEQHRDYREFNRENRTRQTEYFRWRHDHPDSTIFKVVIK
jgi:hypothetical protein